MGVGNWLDVQAYEGGVVCVDYGVNENDVDERGNVWIGCLSDVWRWCSVEGWFVC